MKRRRNTTKLSLHAAAAAVALALGSTVAIGQQGRDSQHDDREHAVGPQRETATSEQRRSSDAGELEQVTRKHKDLSTFVQALETAGLVDSLTERTRYTIFAPTDDAFESMRKDIDELLEPENRQELTALLRAHIVADDVAPDRLRRLDEAQTLDGRTVDIEIDDGQLMIGDANIVTSNIEQGNLRIYAIDKVLSDGKPQRSASARRENRRG